jgi:hypothetical protein
MKMKKLLLGMTALSGLLTVSASFAVALAPVNRLGFIPAGASATVVCSASRFFPGAPPGTMVKDEAAGGLQTDFLITNTDNKKLMITKIDVYAMTTGMPIASYTPPAPPPASADPADPVFKWTLAPHATTRLSHEAVLPPNQVANPALLWNTVVFTIQAPATVRILSPLVYSDYAEFKTPATGGTIIDRIRTPCVIR